MEKEREERLDGFPSDVGAAAGADRPRHVCGRDGVVQCLVAGHPAALACSVAASRAGLTLRLGPLAAL